MTKTSVATSPRPGKKLPLTDKPLRLPGQSVDEHINSVIYDKQISPFVLFLICLSASVVEILFWILNTPRSTSAILMSGYAACTLLYAVRSWRQSRSHVEALKLGRDGERAVAEVLQAQVQKGNAVFHDVVGPNFNLDHVVVAPQGVYVIETKTISKPIGSGHDVSFDGDVILVDGRPMDRDPVEQSLAEIRWLRDLLRKSTGSDIPVRGIVVFPGWYVKSDHSNYERKVWVMNPKNIDGFIAAGHSILPVEMVHMVAFHLSRFIRTTE